VFEDHHTGDWVIDREISHATSSDLSSVRLALKHVVGIVTPNLCYVSDRCTEPQDILLPKQDRPIAYVSMAFSKL
jgi:hypothetical protein